MNAWNWFVRFLRDTSWGTYRPRRHPPIRAVRKRVSLENLEDRWLPSSLCGYVYNDVNDNGLKETGEPGISGVTLTLSGTTSQNQTVNLTQATDATGFYNFANLGAGTYSVRAVQPAGYLAGLASPGTQGGTATGTALTSLVLGGSTDGTGNNFGELASAGGWSAIASNFNGTAIAAGNTLWFTSVFKVNGLGSNPVTLRFANQTISFAAGGTNYTLNVPNAAITLAPATTTATTTFDPTTNTWVTNLPSHFSGNGFLSGLAFPVTTALPGGIQGVQWQGRFSSDTPGVSVNWQWATAVYTNFSTSSNALNVKPVDDNQASQYKNSDHAGTPEAYTAFVIGGAQGGGGSNFTGSYSATKSSTPPQLASLSGAVLNSGAGLANVIVTLTGTNSLGQTVTLSTTTNASGFYSFLGLLPGTYTLTQTVPNGYQDSQNNLGTLGGSTFGNQFTNIALNAGVNGSAYNFGDSLLTGSGGSLGTGS